MVSHAATLDVTAVTSRVAFAATNPLSMGFKPGNDIKDVGANALAGGAKVEAAAQALGALGAAKSQLNGQQAQADAAAPKQGLSTADLVKSDMISAAGGFVLDQLVPGAGSAMRVASILPVAASLAADSLKTITGQGTLVTGVENKPIEDLSFKREGREERSAFESQSNTAGPNLFERVVAPLGAMAGGEAQPAVAQLTAAEIDALEGQWRGTMNAGLDQLGINDDAQRIAAMGSFADEKADPAGGVKTRDLRPDMDFQRQFQPAAYAPAFA